MRLISLAALCGLLLTACNNPSEPAQNTALSEAASAETGQLEQAVQAALSKAEEQASLNSFIHLDRQSAVAQAKALDAQAEKGALYGVLLAVKDNIHVAGMPNTAGTPGLRDFQPTADNAVVSRLKAAGAIVLGKANMHELAFGITSDNAAFGPVRNPANPETFAGGSSGGTAAAIAAGIVNAGLGTDTGGSVRLPAALTGIVGFRPSTGRYESGLVTPVSHTRDTIGPMARTVSDVIKLDAVITAENPELAAIDLSTIRLGIDRGYYFSNLDPATRQGTEQALKRLQAAGVTLVEAAVPELASLLAQSGFPIALYEAVEELSSYLKEHNTGLSLAELIQAIASPDVKAVFQAATAADTAISDEVYQAALAAREQLRDQFKRYFAEHRLDAMVFPTTKLPARPIENSVNTVELNGEQVPTFPSYIHNTDPGSIAALPGISIPMGSSESGLPLGLELDGPEGTDRRLLALALAVEQVLSNESPVKPHTE